jgi:hypothetical protein
LNQDGSRMVQPILISLGGCARGLVVSRLIYVEGLRRNIILEEIAIVARI